MLWSKIKDLFSQTIIQLLVAGVIAVTAWILAKIAALPAYQILIVIIIVIAFTFWGINQFAYFRERQKKKLSKYSDKEIENTIREWVNIPRWSVQPLSLEDKAKSAGVKFGYVIKHDSFHITIEGPSDDPFKILLLGGLNMESKKPVLTNPEWERLAGQLSIEMARLGIQWEFIGKPNKLNTIQFFEPVILDDSTTGYDFRSRIMSVVRALILAQEVWKEALRLSEKPSSDKEGSQS